MKSLIEVHDLCSAMMGICTVIPRNTDKLLPMVGTLKEIMPPIDHHACIWKGSKENIII